MAAIRSELTAAAQLDFTDPPREGGTLLHAARCHGPIALVGLLAAFLLLTNLGRDYLWEDEGDTAVLALSILHDGVPMAWDGVTFTVPDYGQRLSSGLVMVSHPWLQYYAAAGSFALFGETPWAARLPFALAGLGTILVVYAMMLQLLHDRLAAIAAATLLTLNVQFLLFSRQARNYPFHALLTCLLIWQFQRLDSRKQSVLFGVIGVLLFHAHPMGLAAVAALGALTVIYGPLSTTRRWFWPPAVAIAGYALPWLMMSRAGYVQNMNLGADAGTFGPRLLQFAVEHASVAPVLGVVMLSVAVWLRRPASRPGTRRRSARRNRDPIFTPAERLLISACAAITLAEAVLMAITHSRDALWVVGLHHTPELIPLAVVPAGLLITKLTGARTAPWMALMLLFGFTRIAQAAPWTSWAQPVIERNPTAVVSFHVATARRARILRTTQLHFVKSILQHEPNKGSEWRISEFLRANAAAGDVVITNYAWESLYFHTRLPQGAKISSSFPIYRAARAKQLPDYVFGKSHVRWVVWRRAWPAYFPEQDCARILTEVSDAGWRPRLVQRIPETLYENRENVHFHRYAGDRYVYPWYRDLPDVLIFRVETATEAMARDRQRLEDHPDDLDSLASLGTALVHAGQIDEAIPLFRRAVEVAPANADAQRNLANALFDGRQAAEAVVHARRAVALNPADPGSYDVLGRALVVMGHLDDAVMQFERALTIDPADGNVRQHLAQLRRAVDERRLQPSPGHP